MSSSDQARTSRLRDGQHPDVSAHTQANLSAIRTQERRAELPEGTLEASARRHGIDDPGELLDNETPADIRRDVRYLIASGRSEAGTRFSDVEVARIVHHLTDAPAYGSIYSQRRRVLEHVDVESSEGRELHRPFRKDEVEAIRAALLDSRRDDGGGTDG